MNKEDLALELFRLGLVKIGKFRLTSGLESPFYIDLKGLIGYPALLREIATMLFNTAKEKCTFDTVVGIATGGIPIVSFISCLFNIPMAYVRKEKREHGTMRLVEGDIRKKRVLLVDDVATTGGSLEKAVKVLRGNEGLIDYAIVIVDREQGARKRLSALGVKLLSFLTARELLQILWKRNIISRDTYELILNHIKKV